MTKWFPSLFATLMAQKSYCQNIGDSPKAKGVVPTVSGQIGVNPVTDLGPERYHNIGPNTQWYQPDGSTTKWIGPNTEYLTDLPYTTTVNNQPTVTKAPAAVVAVTATASGQGVSAGDVSIAISPKLLNVLNRLFDEAQASCGGQRKRASCDINQRFAQRVAEEVNPGGAFDFVGPESRALLPSIAASDVSAIVGSAAAASPLVGLAVTWVLVGKLQAWTIGSASVVPGGKGDDGDNKCPADAPRGVDAPLCVDTECKGDNTKSNQKCTEGKYKGCDCLTTGEVVDVYDADTAPYDDGLSWLDLQQKLLKDFASESYKSPFCYPGAFPRGHRIPKEYCNCGNDNRKTLRYSVATSTASPYNPCPYTTNDGPTVTFQTESTAAPSATPVVACASAQERGFSSSDGFNFINQFCNYKYGRTLRMRPAGGGMSNAESQLFNGNKDPFVRIYAYLDDACREKEWIKMDKEECTKALDAIINNCDKDTEEKKMGGSVAINCQWFNIAAFKGPTRWPTCNGIPSEERC
ncbi:uncharacterized protein K460DRAFT_356147 [Cucurbitaria berberidis CBS 394.84]|uniref:Uncharacterized protein n=1 Tax=Cucurbitaria berberidis CBS 394.84 TaxID=1168544 RepID=A0A9P4GJX6_9PLEO|nr:uncharacterized protein K460DRAFT_356147 [Cucurbitaria berberidis CBS 394.84]KAF1846475.1 hypothetical protein K460DRAFT_356147 [Cucurbitaria berberidis CBS 394.84]